MLVDVSVNIHVQSKEVKWTVSRFLLNLRLCASDSESGGFLLSSQPFQ
jgi:hypothetical protein